MAQRSQPTKGVANDSHTFDSGGVVMGTTAKHSVTVSILISCLLWTQPCLCEMCITNDNFIAVRDGMTIEAAGLTFTSPGGHLIPIPDGVDASAAPFQFLLSNSANDVTYANKPGSAITLEPGSVLSVGYALGQDFDLSAALLTEEGTNIEIFIVLGGGPGALCTLLPGDLNHDTVVNESDVDLFAQDIGHLPGFNFEFDTDLDNSGGLVNQDDLELFLSGDFLSDGPKLNGDADFSGTVDVADFLILSENFGQDGKKWSEGDFVVDGTVEIEDFLLLSKNFGNPILVAASVPESSSLSSLFVGVLLFTLGRINLRRRAIRQRHRHPNDAQRSLQGKVTAAS